MCDFDGGVGAGGKTWCAVSHLAANLPGAIESSRLKQPIEASHTITRYNKSRWYSNDSMHYDEQMQRGHEKSRYKEPLRDAFLHPVCAICMQTSAFTRKDLVMRAQRQ